MWGIFISTVLGENAENNIELIQRRLWRKNGFRACCAGRLITYLVWSQELSEGLRGACEDRSEALTVGTLLCYTTIVMGNKEIILN